MKDLFPWKKLKETKGLEDSCCLSLRTERVGNVKREGWKLILRFSLFYLVAQREKNMDKDSKLKETYEVPHWSHSFTNHNTTPSSAKYDQYTRFPKLCLTHRTSHNHLPPTPQRVGWSLKFIIFTHRLVYGWWWSRTAMATLDLFSVIGLLWLICVLYRSKYVQVIIVYTKWESKANGGVVGWEHWALKRVETQNSCSIKFSTHTCTLSNFSRRDVRLSHGLNAPNHLSKLFGWFL